jgi:hypothetical protein
MISKMQGWHLYKKETDLTVSCDSVRLIVTRLGSISTILASKRHDFTNQIKYELIRLGYERGFCAYACLKKKSRSDAQQKFIKKKVDEINKIIQPFIIEFGLTGHKFSNREWLYDIHWYRDMPNTHYMPEILELVAESEFDNKRPSDTSNGRYSAVKYDFQKLLVSNANLRLMIFSVKNVNEDLYSTNGLAKYFSEAIEFYSDKQLLPNSRFLFVCYCKGEVLYKEMIKE